MFSPVPNRKHVSTGTEDRVPDLNNMRQKLEDRISLKKTGMRDYGCRRVRESDEWEKGEEGKDVKEEEPSRVLLF